MKNRLVMLSILLLALVILSGCSSIPANDVDAQRIMPSPAPSLKATASPSPTPTPTPETLEQTLARIERSTTPVELDAFSVCSYEWLLQDISAAITAADESKDIEKAKRFRALHDAANKVYIAKLTPIAMGNKKVVCNDAELNQPLLAALEAYYANESSRALSQPVMKKLAIAAFKKTSWETLMPEGPKTCSCDTLIFTAKTLLNDLELSLEDVGLSTEDATKYGIIEKESH